MNAPDPAPEDDSDRARTLRSASCLRDRGMSKSCRTSKRSARRSPRRCAAIRRCSCSARTSAPYGGAFGVTQGLFEEFGEMRVVDTPISESAIIGVSIGAALRGYRPVAEMQFADFISCGFDQIVNQAATLRYRYGGRASVPIVVRAPSGGNVGGGLYHSQNPEAWFIHRPGLKVVAPSTAVRRQGAAEGGDPRRQPGDLLRAQVSLPPRQGAGAGRRRDRADRRRRDAARGQRRDAAHLRRDGDAVARGRRPAGEGRRRGRGDRSAHADAVRQGRRSSARSRRPAAC